MSYFDNDVSGKEWDEIDYGRKELDKDIETIYNIQYGFLIKQNKEE